jgi:SAM-dependent methyltransferase
MVHALREAHRVLKPNGILVDLRPAAVHRRVGVVCNGDYRQLGSMREKFDDDWAANRAVARILHEGLFKTDWRTQFDCRRVMDTVDEFRSWVDDFVRLGDLPSHDWLIEEVESALKASRGKTKIVARGPLVMRVLRKLDVGGQ